MKLENQVCSLELAKKLKELDVKQESLFLWQVYSNGSAHIHLGRLEGFDVEYVSAFTVAELGEMLPAKLKFTTPPEPFPKTEQTTLMCGRYGSDGYWEITYVGVESENIYVERQAVTEANARAKMLIYLLENKLITL
jgi:hypothetical protein